MASRDRDDDRKKPKKGFWQKWGDNIASGSVGFMQRRIETSLEERLLRFIRANPWVRMYYERHGPITVDLLSMALKGMPDPGNQGTFFGKLIHEGKDVAEIIPREIARILDNRLDLQPGAAPAGRQGQPPASFLGFVKFLEPELRSHFPAFVGFYSGLSDDRQRAIVVTQILSRATADVVVFMQMTAFERVEMIKLLTPTQVSARKRRKARTLEPLDPVFNKWTRRMRQWRGR